MLISHLQLRALARYICSLVVPPQTLEDVLVQSIIANTGAVTKLGASAVVSTASNAGQTTTLTIIPGSWGPADVISAMELFLEVVEELTASGTPEDEMCSGLLARLVPPPRQIVKNFTTMPK